MERENKNSNSGIKKANTGNASNPSPGSGMHDNNQYLPKEAEKYIREAGNIEDLPDANDQENMDETIQKQPGA